MKLQALEKWADDGVPFGQEVPRTIAALRVWRGPAGDLDVWSSHSMLAPSGRNKDLRIRYGNVQKRLREAQRLSVAKLQKQVVQLDSQRRRQLQLSAEQNATLLAEREQLLREVAILTTRVRCADDRIRELEARIPADRPPLRAVAPITPPSGSRPED